MDALQFSPHQVTTPVQPCGAEDVRDFQRGARGAPRSWGSLALDGADDLLQNVGSHVDVGRRRVQFLVSEQYLDDAHILLLLRQMSGECVTPMSSER